jgi:anti-sigma regulatory factor (Ser/Thr protein kinase)
MTEGGGGPGTPAFRARFPVEPVSVPTSRRFVADGLASLGRGELAETATLCVSEMATNATLHSGGHFMYVGVRPLHDGVRVSVEDDGTTPASTVTPRRGLVDEPAAVLAGATTGRGLMIVSAVSRRWGVDERSPGLRVWADIVAGDHDYPVQMPDRGAADTTEPTLPENWVTAFLLGCPAELWLLGDQYLDDLTREVQLIAGSRGDAEADAVAKELTEVLRFHAMPRFMARNLAREAAAAGHEYSDFRAETPREIGLDIHNFRAAIRKADELCAPGRLLSSDLPAKVGQLWDWLDETIYDQVAHGAEPVSFQDYVARHPLRS